MARGRAIVMIALMASGGIATADVVAVGPPRVTGAGSAIASSLRASIAGGIAAAGHETVPTNAVDDALSATPAIASCDTDVCLARLAELVHARAAVRATIEVLGSSNYSFRLELVEQESARTIARVDDSCSICTTREANDGISRAARSLAQKLPARGRPPAPPSSEPPPAPAPLPVRHRSPHARILLGFGITTTLLGAGALAGGATLLALDGRTRYGTDPVTHDPTMSTFDGKIPGAVLVAGGGLLVIGGGLLLWRAAVARHAD